MLILKLCTQLLIFKEDAKEIRNQTFLEFLEFLHLFLDQILLTVFY